jgi:hypothetical protein
MVLAVRGGAGMLSWRILCMHCPHIDRVLQAAEGMSGKQRAYAACNVCRAIAASFVALAVHAGDVSGLLSESNTMILAGTPDLDLNKRQTSKVAGC